MNLYHFCESFNSLLETAGTGLYAFLGKGLKESRIADNFAANSSHDITGKMLTSQKQLSAYRFGAGSVADTGCGAVSIYNVLNILRMNPSLAEVISMTERYARPVLGGRAGANPFAAGRVLEQYHLDYELYKSADKMEAAMKNGSVSIVVMWNAETDLLKGAHFYAVEKTDRGIRSYNGPGDHQDQSLAGVIGKGKFIAGYTIQKRNS